MLCASFLVVKANQYGTHVVHTIQITTILGDQLI